MTKEQLQALGISTDKETLTQEEIDELVSKRVAELTGENSKQKSLISQRNSEIADYKRKEQEKLSEDEKAKLHLEELEKRVADYERQSAKSNKVNDYLSIGYPKELAEEIADAELSGKSTAALHQKYLQAREEAIKKELMISNPNPKQTNPTPKSISQEDFKKMGYSEKLALKENDPTLYEKLSKK